MSRSTEPAATIAEAPAVAASATSGLAEPAALQESDVVEAGSRTGQLADPTAGGPRFQIFIIDAGWNSPARKVLQENFALLSELQKGDPIYLLSREKSIEFIRSHPFLMGMSPVLAVHDLDALEEGGPAGFHGFRLHLGLMRTERQALLALQSLARFLATHRQSVDLEADIRRSLRREGVIGAIEIILHHEPRDLSC